MNNNKHNQLQIDYISIKDIESYQRQLRKPNSKQANKAKRFLQEFGFVIPLVIDENKTIVIGEFLYQTAKELNYDSLPVVQITHLDKAQIRTLRVAYDRINEDAEWDREALKIEFEELQILMPDIDLSLTGFEVPEIDAILNLDIQADTDPLNDIPPIHEENARVKLGDLYKLGEHTLYCGDALEEDSYKNLLAGAKVRMVFTDAPYNVKIDGHVGNSGNIQHREFKMASGEMSTDEFTIFLTRAHHQMAKNCRDGAILFSCMDWRHIEEMMIMGRNNNLQFKNLCVWAKDNGGMGSLYRSQHELVFVFKHGTGKHINNVELGQHGRYRTNVWQYPGVNSFGGNRMNELKFHPTVKPVAMVADAILDCSNKGDLILDPFGGSGTTLIAAEKTKRKAAVIELDPLYCDVILRRWEEMTGQTAILIDNSKTVSEQEAVNG